jgi:hypothetical protein
MRWWWPKFHLVEMKRYLHLNAQHTDMHIQLAAVHKDLVEETSNIFIFLLRGRQVELYCVRVEDTTLSARLIVREFLAV